MARISRDTVDYFSHDAGASEGDTLTIMQQRFGNDGYAFWFKLLEKLAKADGHFLDCRNPVKEELLFAKCHIQRKQGVEMLNTLVEMRAIDKELWSLKLIWCQKFVDNLAIVYKNRRRSLPLKPIIPMM